MNGLQLHGGFQVFGALAFELCKTGCSLIGVNGKSVIYVYTHDSIGLGEDGPTHQPVEHVDSLHLIPHLNVFRPADLIETTCAWIHAVQCKEPTAIVLSRQKVPALEHNGERLDEVASGAYILKNTDQQAEVILFASGTEVSLAVETAHLLDQKGLPTKVVSVPCMKLFLEQDADYQAKVLDQDITKRVAIEWIVCFVDAFYWCQWFNLWCG